MKHIWKKLSAGLLAFALVFTTIPPVTVSADTADTGAATSQREEVIDVSTSNSFTIPNTGDVTYVLTGTNTAAEVYIGGDCDIILRDVTLKRIYTNYADALTVNITLDGDNLIHQDKSASQGALEVRRSQVTINGDEDDSLHAKSRAFPAYSNSDEVEAGGGLTINGGNITFELTEQSGGAPIQTAYTQNGGTVKVIGTTSYCFQYKVYMNGGSLEAEHHSAYEGRLAFNHYVYMKNGASIKVSSSERPIGGAGRFKLGEGSSANDCIFVRFDDSSEFVYLNADDETNDVLNDKNYAEIKVMEHNHDFEGNSCSCGFVCRHDTDDGNCSACGSYVYKISHQPTEGEAYVELNDGTGASYQWYEVKNISEITDESKIYPWSYFGAPFEEDSTYDAAAGWTPIDDSYEGDSYNYLYYIASSFKAGDQVTLRFSSPVEYAVIFNQDDEFLCEVDGTTATATILSDGVFGIYAMTKDTEPTVKVYVGDGEVSTLTGQTGAALSKYSYGNYYFCEATAKDGTVLTSGYADFTYKITHQPTDDAQYVSLNDSTGASYQWYEEKGGIVSVTDENAISFTVLGAPSEIGGTYDRETGWTPDEYGYYFVVWLDEGNTMNLEFSQTPEECFYLFSATEGTVEDDVYFGESLTAPASGYYGICAVGGGNLKATMDGTEFIAVSGQTDATLNASELGRYRCEVTFGNGTKKTSDVVEVQHLHAGGTATCKDKAICTTCGIGYGPLSTEHKYDNACDTECNVCRTTRSVTHDYNEATCTTPKKCATCGHTTGTTLPHTVAVTEVTKAATTSQNGTVVEKCTCGATVNKLTITKASNVSLSTASYTYNGEKKSPKVVVKDGAGKTIAKSNYTVIEPSGRKNAGTYTYNVIFQNQYSGTKELKLTIKKAKMSDIKVKGKTVTYNGKAHTITLSGVPEGAKVSYKTSSSGTYSTTKPSRTSAGTTTVYYKVEKSNYDTITGSVKIVVNKKSLSKAVLSKTTYVYSGSAKKPTVTVKNSSGTKLKKNTHYTVTYKNNKKVGKATVTIKGKGNYKGTLTKTFKINPKPTKITKLVKGSKSFTVKWSKRTTQTTGYQIYYTTSTTRKNGKTVTLSKTSTTSKKISSLKSKKKYYVWVRTYRTVNGTKYYSQWSSRKSVTTKK